MDRLHGNGDGHPAEAAPPPGPPEAQPASAAGGTVQQLLLCWQTAAEPGAFERLLQLVAPTVLEVAGRILSRHGVRDPGAADDVVSLVFDHLRRLAPTAHDERCVAPFDATRGPTGDSSNAGAAYIVWLARERALDVARKIRRQSRHVRQLDDHDAASMESGHETDAEDGDRVTLLHEAIGRLPPRDRLVCELLLDGRSQATIAGLLGLCDGTVSRIRQRVIATLRDEIAEP
jgi:RNA polymerase sigma factor (sigma-70 family)